MEKSRVAPAAGIARTLTSAAEEGYCAVREPSSRKLEAEVLLRPASSQLKEQGSALPLRWHMHCWSAGDMTVRPSGARTAFRPRRWWQCWHCRRINPRR